MRVIMGRKQFLTYLLAICLTLFDAVNSKQQSYFLQSQQQTSYTQQQAQNPFGNILGVRTTPKPNINVNSITESVLEKRPKPSRHPHIQPGPVGEEQVVDRFDIRYPDGSYEFRYELVDGTARYERGYFLRVDKLKTLIVVGYYSYRLSDGRYLTVFYNADHFGYRQNQSITPQTYPNLPRSIDVPQLKEENEATNSATPTRGNRF